MSDPVVTFSSSGGVGTITLNRPPANSYEIGLMRALEAAIDQANADPATRAVILQSASEKFFCAGADIKAFLANSTEANMEMVEVAHRTLGKMASSPKVFIAAINGYALGGGLEMTLACDLRFAAEGEYRVGLPEVTLGLLPGNGGTQRLPRLIGFNRALELMITGRTLRPAEALEMGIVNRLFPAAELAASTHAYAARLAAGATVAIGQIKQAVYRGIERSLEEALSIERDLLRPLFDTEDSREGFAAFTEKRKPVFQGK